MCLLGNGKTTKLMDTASILSKKEVDMRVSGIKICKMVREKKSGQIMPALSERTKTERNTEEASLIGQMDRVTSAISTRIIFMAKENTLGRMEEFSMEHGKTT